MTPKTPEHQGVDSQLELSISTTVEAPEQKDSTTESISEYREKFSPKQYQLKLSGVQEDPEDPNKIICQTQQLVANLTPISDEEYSKLMLEAEEEAIVIPGFNIYPDGRSERMATQEFRDKIFERKLRDLSVLSQNNESLRQIIIIGETTRNRISLSTFEAGEELISTNYWLSLALKTLIATHLELIRPQLDFEGTGFFSKTNFKNFSRANITIKCAFLIQEFLLTSPNKYKGISGYLKLARQLGEVNLGFLYTFLSVLGYAEELEWPQINLPYKTAKALVEKLDDPETRVTYQGVRGYFRLAEESGELNLAQLYSLVSALGYAGELEWQQIPLPYKTAKALVEKLDDPETRVTYQGVRGYLKLAEESGELNLGHLYALASALGYAEELEWQKISLPYKIAKALVEKLDNPETRVTYQGVRGYLKLAEESGELHLAQLYSLVSALDYAEKLEWPQINLPYKTAKALVEKLDDPETRVTYQGVRGYFRLAEESGELNLGHLYTLASALGYAEALEWQKISLPSKTAKALVEKLDDPETRVTYQGVRGYFRLAEESGELHLSQLYSLVSALDYAGELEWQKISLPSKTAKALVEKLDDPETRNNYKGIRGYLKLAEESGELNLGHLYSLASALGCAEELEWQQISLPYKTAKALVEKLEDSRTRVTYQGVRGYFRLAEESGELHLSQLYSLVSALGYVGELEWRQISLPYKTAKALVEKLDDPETRVTYQGVRGYLKLAEESGELNLAQLYSLVSALDYAGELEWQKISLPYETAKALVEKLNNPKIRTNYQGIRGYLKLAEESGELHLAQLYSLASALDYAEKLEWPRINFPYKIAKALVEKLEDSRTRNNYKGKKGFNLLVQEFQITESNEYYLKVIAKSLNIYSELGWE